MIPQLFPVLGLLLGAAAGAIAVSEGSWLWVVGIALLVIVPAIYGAFGRGTLYWRAATVGLIVGAVATELEMEGGMF